MYMSQRKAHRQSGSSLDMNCLDPDSKVNRGASRLKFGLRESAVLATRGLIVSDCLRIQQLIVIRLYDCYDLRFP